MAKTFDKSVLKTVWDDNMKFLSDRNVFDVQFMNFLWNATHFAGVSLYVSRIIRTAHRRGLMFVGCDNVQTLTNLEQAQLTLSPRRRHMAARK